MSSAPRVRGLTIFLLALGLRLAVVWLTARTHSADWFFGQASELARLAESLRSGHGLSSPFGGTTGPSAFLAPGYPAIVAVFAIFGSYSFASAVALMTLQAVFGAATVVALVVLTQRAFGTRTATLAGIIWAVSPPLLWLPTLFWETSLSVLLATSFFALCLRLRGDPRVPGWIALAITAACALSINPSLLPILLCCAGWAAFYTRPRFSPVLAACLFLLLCAPWAFRNYRTLHAFIPLRSNMGYELWQGNRAGSDGFFSPELHPNVNAAEFEKYRQLGEFAYMHQKGELAKQQMAAQPTAFLLLTLKRVLYFWTGIVRHSSALVVSYIILTSVFGFTGLGLLWKRERSLAVYFLLPLVLFPLPYYITHPDFRFRLVLDPVVTALTAYALTTWRGARDT